MHAAGACKSNRRDCGSAVCAMTPVDGSHDLVAVEELLLQIPLLLLPVPVLVPRTVPLYHNTLGSGTGKRERKTHRSSAGRDCFRLE
jgi:hypothetical protein